MSQQCYVISYIVDVLGSFVGYKINNKNNKDTKGWDSRKNNLILQMILKSQILILNSMLICNPIQDFEGGGGLQVW
jgi:hypothetical protein